MPETIKPIDVEDLKALVRTVPDFPKPGILFYDITTLLKDKTGFAKLIDLLAAHYIEHNIDLVLGIEARGFIFGPALAYRLNAGFVPVRKPRKLPAPVARVTYDLEYGSDTLEIHMDAIRAWPTRCAGRRPAGHRRHHGGHRKAGKAARRRDCRTGVCGGAGLSEGPRPVQGVRRLQPAAL